MQHGFAFRPARRSVLCALAALVVGAVALSPELATAQGKYPEKPIRFVVPFAAGGATDITARLLSDPLAKVLGQQVVVENRPGAGSNLGAAVVARAEPDGYTFLLASSGVIASPALYENLTYDVMKDLTPVAELVGTTNIFVSKPGTGFDSVADVLKKARAGKISYAHPGVGTTPHLAAELLKLREKLDITAVPYGGAAPATTAILGGNVELGSMALANIHPAVKGGQFKGIAVTSAKRWHDLPDIPTMMELGYADFDLETIFILMAPANTPKAIVDRVSKEVIDILKRPDVTERVQKMGFEVLARGPDVLKARFEKEVPLYKDIVARAGIPKVK
jgi:tripartite-type tricarboxylate transporter receptor subunit TctC